MKAPETPDPPTPFLPTEAVLAAGAVFHRVHANRFRPAEFNPGPNGPGRFHFFGDPMVPALYLAETREAAVAETLLRNIPIGARGLLRRPTYQDSVLAGLEITRPLRIAEFYGLGLTRRLGVEANQLTDTPEVNYPQTRKWAEAAHTAGYEGIGWMSKRDNSAKAYMLFGDRVGEADLAVVPGSGMMFASGIGFDWLVNTCAFLQIDVMPR